MTEHDVTDPDKSVEEAGRRAGVISASDIFNLQGLSPQLLIREIEEAATIDELRMLHLRVQELVALLLEKGEKIQDLIRLIAYLNDQVLLRLMRVVRAKRYAGLNCRFAFVVLGSQGRGGADTDDGSGYRPDL
jgi:CBS domain-containing protein